MPMEARVSVLEDRMNRVDARLKHIDDNLTIILRTLAQMSGGKAALLGLCTLIGIAIGAVSGTVVGVISAIRYWKGG